MNDCRPRQPPAVPARRTLRHAVLIDGMVREPGGPALAIKVVEISTRACRLWTGFRTAPGRVVRLSVAAMPVQRATVVCASDRYATLRFTEPLHPAVLQHMLDANRPAGQSFERVASSTTPSTP